MACLRTILEEQSLAHLCSYSYFCFIMNSWSINKIQFNSIDHNCHFLFSNYYYLATRIIWQFCF